MRAICRFYNFWFWLLGDKRRFDLRRGEDA